MKLRTLVLRQPVKYIVSNKTGGIGWGHNGDDLMLRKMLQRGKYWALDLLGSVLYGVVLYFVSTWLAGYSLLFVYFGNLVLIILFLAIEEYSLRAIKPKDLSETLSKLKDGEKGYRMIQRSLENNLSAKTMMYLFYVFVLIFSQIIDAYPTLVGEDLSNFVLSNNYSILLLIALDMLVGQFSKDRERMKKLSAELEKAFDESQTGTSSSSGEQE